jgi:hypothetical protein
VAFRPTAIHAGLCGKSSFGYLVREMALTLPSPLNFALEKALRRHVEFRTATVMELWRDLHAPQEIER